MIDNTPETYSGVFDTLAQAEARAIQLQQEGRETKIEVSLLYFKWIVFAAPRRTLAPDIVAAIVEGRQPRSLTVKRLLQGIPCAWADQRTAFGLAR